MVVEPFANDQLKDNLNPVGRVYYSFSTLLCTPCSRSQEVGLCLGAQAGEARIREVVTSAGFKRLPARYGNAFQYRLRSAAVILFSPWSCKRGCIGELGISSRRTRTPSHTERLNAGENQISAGKDDRTTWHPG